MATVTVNQEHNGTLVANTVDTVTVEQTGGGLQIVNASGDYEIWFTVGPVSSPPAAPTVGGDDVNWLPAAVCLDTVSAGPSAVVKLISAGTPEYEVKAGPQ